MTETWEVEERQAVCLLTGVRREVHRSTDSTSVTIWSRLSEVIVWILNRAPVQGVETCRHLLTLFKEKVSSISSYSHLQCPAFSWNVHNWALSFSPGQIFSQFIQQAVRVNGFWVYPRQQLKYRTTGVKLSTCGHGRGTQPCLSPQQLYRNV